jgi:hypothetical protein
MADQNPTGPGTTRFQTTADEDTYDQARVLREVLFVAPEAMTLEELIRELTVASTDVMEQDRIKRAVRDLVSGGLLHRVDTLVLPTRAAVNYYLLGEV